jgi:pyridoxine 4-dehydrogenase
MTFPLGPYQVQPIGFGAMQLPGPGVFGPPRDRTEALTILRRAIELGVDHIDTAQYYGPVVANELIRDALHPYPSNLAIVSKVGGQRDDQGRWLPAQRPEELRQGVLDNLRTLQIDRLAAVNLRLMEGSGVDFDEQLDAMTAMRDEGLIAGVGLSNVSLEQFEHAVGRTAVVCVQNPLNLVDRASLPLLRACADRGVAFVPFFPLGSAFGGTNRVLTNPDVLAAADQLSVTPAQVALAWTLTLGPNVLLIPGTSSVRHLEENLAAGALVLDEKTQQALDGVVA